jgi:hypothetical protein
MMFVTKARLSSILEPIRVSLLGIFALWADVSYAANVPLRYVSPDRTLTAMIVPLGRDLGAKQIQDYLEYECRVDIYDAKRRRVWSEDFGSPDHDHGRGVAFACWSPDSNYFVFSTVSSGGHHPWEYFTYAFDRQHRILRVLNDLVGPVVQTKFRLSSPDIISLAVWHPDAPNAEFLKPTKHVSLALHKLLKR